MKRGMFGIGLVAVVATLVGCDVLTGIIQGNTVEVALVNESDFDVDVTLFFDDDQDTIAAILVETGTRLDFTIPAGETVSFVQSCDDIQAIVIDDADLQVIGAIGPEANSDILRDGSDFGCGDVIRFIFSHSALIVDFDITTSVSAP